MRWKYSVFLGSRHMWPPTFAQCIDQTACAMWCRYQKMCLNCLLKFISKQMLLKMPFLIPQLENSDRIWKFKVTWRSLFEIRERGQWLDFNRHQMENRVCRLRPVHNVVRHLYCWFHGSRIILAALNLVFWTFFCAKTCCVVCHLYFFCYNATNMARRNVQKTTFDSTFEMIRL